MDTDTLIVPRIYQKGFEVKEVDAKRRRTVGLLSTKAPDREQDVVDQKSLQGHLPTFIEKNGIVLFMHGFLAGIGSVVDWSGNENETHVVVDYGKGHDIIVQGITYSMDNIWSQIEQRILRTHSYGFFAKREDLRNGNFGLTVTELLEVSVVTIPANRDAVFQVAKALQLCELGDAKPVPEVGARTAVARALALARLRLTGRTAL